MKYIFDLRYVKLISYKFAKAVQEAENKNHKHRYAYYYGFQFILGIINEILMLLTVSLLFGATKYTMLVALVFASIRVWSGGFHFNDYTLCAYISTLIIVIGGVLGKFLHYSFPIALLIFTFVLYMFIRFAPNSKTIKEIQKKKIYKTISITMLIIWFIISLMIQSMSVIIGMLITGIILLPFRKYKAIE